MLVHKSSSNKFNKIEITPIIFSNYNEIKLEISNKKKIGKFANMWKLNSIPLNNWWVKEEIIREIRKCQDKWKWKHGIPKFMGCNKGSTKREAFVVSAYIKKRRSQINNLMSHPKELEK